MSTAVEHYDAKAQAAGPSEGRTELQRFHNEAKRVMLKHFAFKAPRLLDLACGRGGDIHKWRALSVGYVKGVDVSSASIEEAKARAEQSRGVARTVLDFEHGDAGRAWTDGTEYDVVTCFFALHYFFASESVAHALMANVAGSLRKGGAFVGITASGRRVVDRLKHADVFDNGVVEVRSCWQGAPQCFGSAYTFAARDTVTEASAVPEYLVFANVLVKVARMHGLTPVAVVDKAFEARGPLHALHPPYTGPLAECSEMYAAFAFRKL